MDIKTPIFFCAIGGSGMLPLAMLLKAQGYRVIGSDRARDQGRTPERFTFLEQAGIRLFPQDGSGIADNIGRVVVSTAVEPTVPDYAAAVQRNIPIVHRAALLAELFNKADTSVAIAGTSGKSTTAGMTGWILSCSGKNPTIVNGATMKNFMGDNTPFASFVAGNPDLFVAEVDESDGSIEHFRPTVAVMNNISLDHKSIEELRELFQSFVSKAGHVVINLDNNETELLAAKVPSERKITFSQKNKAADLFATNPVFGAGEVSFDLFYKKEKYRVALNVPGEHNVANSLAALGAVISVGVSVVDGIAALSRFSGIMRRMDVVGSASGVTVIDDFAHNPDKISATLRALHHSEGRLLVLFQPHGYGPLRLMRQGFVDAFCSGLKADDKLVLCDPLYLGGTTDRSVGSQDLVLDMQKRRGDVFFMANRDAAVTALVNEAQPGDRLVIMGARDDTLPVLAQDAVHRLQGKDQH